MVSVGAQPRLSIPQTSSQQDSRRQEGTSSLKQWSNFGDLQVLNGQDGGQEPPDKPSGLARPWEKADHQWQMGPGTRRD